MKIPIHHDESHELLGYVDQDGTSWKALTLFNYIIARTDSKEAAKATVREQGLGYLQGVWHYYDKSDHDWFPCIIKQAYEHKIVVNRTTEMGYQDPSTFKVVTLTEINENTLIKG